MPLPCQADSLRGQKFAKWLAYFGSSRTCRKSSYLCDSAAYSNQNKWPKKKKKETDGDDDNEEEDDVDGEGGVRAILLDEDGYWNPLMAALKVRLCCSSVQCRTHIKHTVLNTPTRHYAAPHDTYR